MHLVRQAGPFVAAYVGLSRGDYAWDVRTGSRWLASASSVVLLYLDRPALGAGRAAVRSSSLLGRYSLFAYVAQIAALQLLVRIWPPRGLDPGALPDSGRRHAVDACRRAATDALRSRVPRSRVSDGVRVNADVSSSVMDPYAAAIAALACFSFVGYLFRDDIRSGPGIGPRGRRSCGCSWRVRGGCRRG